jgi:hypothetical protein
VRRPLHCLLVGFLVFSLSVDTARACWRLRHAHRSHAAACPVDPACGGWSPVVVVADAAIGCGWAAAPLDTATIVPVGGWVEEIACGQPLPCCESEFDGAVVEAYAIAEPAADGTFIAESPTVSGEVLAARPAVPELAPAAEPVGRPEPLQPVPGEQPSIGSAAPSRPAVPDDQPVEPAAANTPAEPGGEGPAVADPSTPATREMRPDQTATDPEPELSLPATPEPKSPEPPAEVGQLPATPEPTPQPGPATEPPAPAEPNLFEEADASPAPPAGKPEAAADEPARDPLPAAEPEPPATDPEPPATDPEPPATDPEPTATDPEPTPEPEPPNTAPVENVPEPAAEPAPPDAVEPAADPLSRSERNRRWIDASGRYAVVGALVSVLDGRAEIRRPDGRSISVPLDRLSPFDRAYAEEAGRWIAGAAVARPTETAGL